MAQKPKQDDPAQSKRFIETARKVGADGAGNVFEHVLDKMIPAAKKKKPTASDPRE